MGKTAAAPSRCAGQAGWLSLAQQAGNVQVPAGAQVGTVLVASGAAIARLPAEVTGKIALIWPVPELSRSRASRPRPCRRSDVPAQRAKQHRGVVHEAFAVTLGGVFGQHAQKSPHSPACHMRTTSWSSRSRKGLQILNANSGVWPFWAKRCESEPLRRKDCHGAVVLLFDGASDGPAQLRALSFR
jgi:hypothetical protein